MKIPISLLRKLYLRIITYLDNILLMGVTKKEVLMVDLLKGSAVLKNIFP